MTIVESNSVTFTCVANGSPEPKVTWLFGGVAISGANVSNQVEFACLSVCLSVCLLRFIHVDGIIHNWFSSQW